MRGLVGGVWLRVPLRAIPVFFFNDTATTEIYTLSLHDALPICLLIEIWPQLTTTEASSWPLPSFEVVTVAVLTGGPQLCMAVSLTTRTPTLCPEARSCGP